MVLNNTVSITLQQTLKTKYLDRVKMAVRKFSDVCAAEEEVADEELAVEGQCPELAEAVKAIGCQVDNFKTAFDDFQTKLGDASDDDTCKVKKGYSEYITINFKLRAKENF